MSDILLNRDFKFVILNIFKELKKAMCKELKESMRIVSHQIEKTNEDIDIIKKKKKEPNKNSAVENFHS